MIFLIAQIILLAAFFAILGSVSWSLVPVPPADPRIRKIVLFNPELLMQRRRDAKTQLQALHDQIHCASCVKP